MKLKIVTTISYEVDVQLKNWDSLEPLCNRVRKMVKEWVDEEFEDATVATTFVETE